MYSWLNNFAEKLNTNIVFYYHRTGQKFLSCDLVGFFFFFFDVKILFLLFWHFKIIVTPRKSTPKGGTLWFDQRHLGKTKESLRALWLKMNIKDHHSLVFQIFILMYPRKSFMTLGTFLFLHFFHFFPLPLLIYVQIFLPLYF